MNNYSHEAKALQEQKKKSNKLEGVSENFFPPRPPSKPLHPIFSFQHFRKATD